MDFDVDEFIRKRRESESFGVVKDRQGHYISFPRMPKAESEPEIISKQSPTVNVDYTYETISDLSICCWDMQMAVGMDWETPQKIKEWTDGKISVDDTSVDKNIVQTRGEGAPIISLVISGKGKDGRCKWCNTFWKAFSTNSERRSFDIHLDEECIFRK